MDTPTQKIKLPKSGLEVELKDWINAKDAEYIEEALYSGIEIKTEGGKPKMGKFNPAVVNEQSHREIEKFVVAVGDKKENLLIEVLSLPEDDYTFLQTVIQERRPKKKVVDIGLS